MRARNITPLKKIRLCKKCGRSRIGNDQKCECGYKWLQKASEKSRTARSTDYVPLPAITPEEREKSSYAMTVAMKKLAMAKPATERIVKAMLRRGVAKYPELFTEKRWDKYRESAKEENNAMDNVQEMWAISW